MRKGIILFCLLASCGGGEGTSDLTTDTTVGEESSGEMELIKSFSYADTGTTCYSYSSTMDLYYDGYSYEVVDQNNQVIATFNDDTSTDITFPIPDYADCVVSYVDGFIDSNGNLNGSFQAQCTYYEPNYYCQVLYHGGRPVCFDGYTSCELEYW